jgi:hypothetical protein
VKRGEAEYRVRWRRAPAFMGWRVRLFQEEWAAKKFAHYLCRPKPMRRIYGGGEYGPSYDEELPPVLECVIQMRPTGPWSVHEQVRSEDGDLPIQDSDATPLGEPHVRERAEVHGGGEAIQHAGEGP